MSTKLNFGHQQNSEKSFNSKMMMKNLVLALEQVSLDKISKILLTVFI